MAGAPAPPPDGGPVAKAGDAGETSTTPRVNFPETWLWTDETIGYRFTDRSNKLVYSFIRSRIE